MENRSVPATPVIPVLAYADVAEAADWLCNAFGFAVRLRIGDHRAQLVFGDGAVIVTKLGATDSGPGAHSVHVSVEDADRYHEQAAKSGALIHNPPDDYPYGERSDLDQPRRSLGDAAETLGRTGPTLFGLDFAVAR